MSKKNLYSKIPAVDKLLHELQSDAETVALPSSMLTSLVRGKVETLRMQIEDGAGEIGSFDAIIRELKLEAFFLYQSRIHSVINGTGVIIHTNLGRAPLSKSVAEKIVQTGVSYNNIEVDLATGERGKRGGFLELALTHLIEAEAATVCNNCASALILILKHLANGARNEVIISRGELVEIGGGFRVPEIMEVSGARLIEVGATNKTSLADYRNAVSEKTGLILKVHRSNFYIEGFTHEPATEELVALGKELGVPVAEDLGSGAMLPTEELASIPHEPTATEVLRKGVDVVCASGDKLFGGPQAGIIAGNKDLIAGIKAEPFFRALRCDKLILTGLQETVIEYLNARSGGHRPDLPLAEMLSADVGALEKRAKKIIKQVGGDQLQLGEGWARCGGGTMPKAEISSVTVDVVPRRGNLKKLAETLRARELAIIGYIADDKFRLDLRTIFPEQDGDVAKALKEALKE